MGSFTNLALYSIPLRASSFIRVSGASLSPKVSPFARGFVLRQRFGLSLGVSSFSRGFRISPFHLNKVDSPNNYNPDNIHTNEIPITTDEPNIFLTANQLILEFIHENTGLPWWATIIFTTIILRSAFTLPVAIYQQKSYSRLLKAQPLINSWIEKLKHKVARKSRMEKRSYEEFQAALQKEVTVKVKEIYQEIGWHPIKSYLMPWYQIPLFICMSFTLREMINSANRKKEDNASNYENVESIAINAEKFDDFTNGGVFWFPDLTITDSTWFFPLAVGITNLFNIEFQTWISKGTPTTKQKIIKNIGRVLCLVMVPVCSQAPTAICVYWLTSATFSAVQNVVFRLPYVQRLLGFPL